MDQSSSNPLPPSQAPSNQASSNQASRTLVELLYGKGAHVNPAAVAASARFETCARILPGFPHSIWQILWHMNYWMEYELARIRGEAPAYPAHARESWPGEPGPGNRAEWERTSSRFCALLGELASLAGAGDQALHRPVAPAHPVHTQQSGSVLAVLWQLMAHNSYHVGQVVLLQRALGEYSELQGDTW